MAEIPDYTGSRLIAGTMRLGAWGEKFTTSQYIDFITQCLEAGIDTFDLADIYGDYTQERDFGMALAERPDLRRLIKIITKCGICRVCDNRPQYQIKHYDTGKSHLLNSIANSLKLLHTDHIDMLLIHRPDPLLDADEIALTVKNLKKEGLILEFGVSNFTPSQFDLLSDRAELATNQIEVSLLHLYPFNNGVLDNAQRHRIAPQAWSPLGGGALFQPGGDERIERIRGVIGDMEKKYDATTDQILLAFLLKHPAHIRPVLGTTKTERILSAAAALDLNLSREDWFKLWTASTGNRVP